MALKWSKYVMLKMSLGQVCAFSVIKCLSVKNEKQASDWILATAVADMDHCSRLQTLGWLWHSLTNSVILRESGEFSRAVFTSCTRLRIPLPLLTDHSSGMPSYAEILASWSEKTLLAFWWSVRFLSWPRETCAGPNTASASASGARWGGATSLWWVHSIVSVRHVFLLCPRAPHTHWLLRVVLLPLPPHNSK